MPYTRPVPGNDPDFSGGNNHTEERFDAAHGSNGKRQNAAQIAANRPIQYTSNNNELTRYPNAWPSSFHKGIPHSYFGIPDSIAFHEFLHALSREGFADGAYAPFDVALGPAQAVGNNPGNRDGGTPELFHSAKGYENSKYAIPEVRSWESPLGGHVYDVQGPDAGDVAMAPAPTLPNTELAAEMAEVYAMALLRDVPFHKFENDTYTIQRFTLNATGENLDKEDGDCTVGEVIEALNEFQWFTRDDTNSNGFTWSYQDQPTDLEIARHKARFDEPLSGSNAPNGTQVTGETLFRGSVPGAKKGPYVSQFLLIGHPLRGGGTRAGGAALASFSDALEHQRGRVPAASVASAGFDVQAKENRAATARLAPKSADEEARKRAISEGRILYGAQVIDQRVDGHQPGLDHMTEWGLWLDVQNGANVRGSDRYYPDGKTRFITRPRDLATFVHFDELYQAYLNACLLLFNFGHPFDAGFPSGGSHATRGSFATFGGPHLLSLMTEVASRGLKAVRRQKFQHHLRGRPEQLAAMLTLVANWQNELGTDGRNARDTMQDFLQLFQDENGDPGKLLQCIASHNAFQNQVRANSQQGADPDGRTIFPRKVPHVIKNDDDEVIAVPWDGDVEPHEGKNFLLPMAFPEGSPMHAAYGAGHATVAGACVTILKAFFELSKGSGGTEKVTKHPLTVQEIKNGGETWWTAATMGPGGLGLPCLFRGPDEYDVDHEEAIDKLIPIGNENDADELTIEGELNKLAANISIGRNMAGVHYYTDYYDSLRMGERVAVGVLQEQMATSPEEVSMRLTSFDNDRLIIFGDGKGAGKVEIWDGSAWVDAVAGANSWWNRHIADFQPGGSPGPI